MVELIALKTHTPGPMGRVAKKQRYQVDAKSAQVLVAAGFAKYAEQQQEPTPKGRYERRDLRPDA